MELTSREWKEFSIEDLFKIKIGKNIDGNKIDKLSGKSAYITRSLKPYKTNCGIKTNK